MNVWVLLVHLISFIVIFSVAAIWLWKPTVDFASRQKKVLEKQKKDLVVNNREARYFLGLLRKEKYELMFAKRAIIKVATEEAEKMRVEARIAAEQMLKESQIKADAKVQAIEERARERVGRYIADAAKELAEKLVDANLNDANNKAVVDAYISSLKDKKIISSEEGKVFH